MPTKGDAAAAPHVTRDVDPIAVRYLLDDPPRATVAFVDGEAIELVPVRARARDDTYLIGVGADAAADLAGREVVLVLDDGTAWFELCGMSVRGIAAPIEAPEPAAAEPVRWYAIAARRVLAWDYGTIREE